MTTSTRLAHAASARSTGFAVESGVSSDEIKFNLRHELVDAQVDVLRMYMEKKPTDRLLAAVDRLIDCTRASFRDEEALLAGRACGADPAHRERHDGVLAHMELLRRYVRDSDRGRLLAQLILVDRQLTAHISDAVEAPDRTQLEYM